VAVVVAVPPPRDPPIVDVTVTVSAGPAGMVVVDTTVEVMVWYSVVAEPPTVEVSVTVEKAVTVAEP
jgi:hypothetical protein